MDLSLVVIAVVTLVLLVQQRFRFLDEDESPILLLDDPGFLVWVMKRVHGDTHDNRDVNQVEQADHARHCRRSQPKLLPELFDEEPHPFLKFGYGRILGHIFILARTILVSLLFCKTVLSHKKWTLA